MVIDFEKIHDIDVDNDGIMIKQYQGDSVYIYMSEQDKELLRERLNEAHEAQKKKLNVGGRLW